MWDLSDIGILMSPLKSWPADAYQKLPNADVAESSEQSSEEIREKDNLLLLWKQQFTDAFVVLYFYQSQICMVLPSFQFNCCFWVLK